MCDTYRCVCILDMDAYQWETHFSLSSQLACISLFCRSSFSPHSTMPAMKNINSIENNVKHIHARWDNKSTHQAFYYLLSNKWTRILLPRSFRCVIWSTNLLQFSFLHDVALRCECCCYFRWPFFGSLWHNNTIRACIQCLASHLLLAFNILHERNLSFWVCVRAICSLKCTACEYLHNWMIWYSIRQFEHHSLAFDVFVCLCMWTTTSLSSSMCMDFWVAFDSWCCNNHLPRKISLVCTIWIDAHTVDEDSEQVSEWKWGIDKTKWFVSIEMHQQHRKQMETNWTKTEGKTGETQKRKKVPGNSQSM